MRVFYIFKINDNFTYMYKNNSYKIFKFLQELRFISDYDVVDTNKKLKEIVCKLECDEINDYIINNLYNYQDYYNKKNVHIICNNNECTKLVVEDYMIRIKSNQKYPDILNYINCDNIFVCDFINKDYFWLNIKKTVA